MKKNGEPINDRQKRFAEEYVVDLNATQAAIRAGYSAKTAGQQAEKLLRKAEIQAYLAEFRKKVQEKTMRTVADVLADIGRVRENSMQVVHDPETGVHVMVDTKAALKALELEGKHLGAFIERKEITNPDGSLRPTLIQLVAPDE